MPSQSDNSLIAGRNLSNNALSSFCNSSQAAVIRLTAVAASFAVVSVAARVHSSKVNFSFAARTLRPRGVFFGRDVRAEVLFARIAFECRQEGRRVAVLREPRFWIEHLRQFVEPVIALPFSLGLVAVYGFRPIELRVAARDRIAVNVKNIARAVGVNRVRSDEREL